GRAVEPGQERPIGRAGTGGNAPASGQLLPYTVQPRLSGREVPYHYMLSRDVLILLLLILLNGFFALSEMALVAAKRVRLQAAAEQGRAGAKSALALMEDPTT